MERERVEVLTREELRNWLAANHTRNEAVWLVSHKKASPHYLEYDAIVEEALCFGWIDSTANALDDMRSMLLPSPRRKGSMWSRANKIRVDKLAAAGLLRPPGLAKIEQAKLDGSWTFLDDIDALIVPPDLQAALESQPPALDYWTAFPPSAKRAILYWVKSAKRPGTRATRIGKSAELAARNIRATTPEAKGL